MPSTSSSRREDIIDAYLMSLITRDIYAPYTVLKEANTRFILDASIIQSLEDTRYLNGRNHNVPKLGNLPLAWEYAQSPQDHHRFRNMLRIPPLSFHVLLGLIEPHPIFQSGSQNAQVEVEIQLAVTLYRMGRYRNGASVQEVARVAGISEGSVENYTERCLTAIESLHDMFVHQLTPEEKEQEKKWVDKHLGFKGTWWEGWVMYDGAIVVLYPCPGMQGETYYTRKGNYGFNVQVWCSISNILWLSHADV